LEVATSKDLRLVNRALKEKWNVDKEAIKAALMQCLSDPDLAVDAAKVLLVADALDCKREELDAKREVKENEQRLRLLELAQSVPIAELAKLASENGVASRSGQG
jgi:chaperonin GroEL (HSP60 family)